MGLPSITILRDLLYLVRTQSQERIVWDDFFDVFGMNESDISDARVAVELKMISLHSGDNGDGG